MALTSYADLQASVAGWIGRTDLTGVIPDFVALFETMANRRLRVRKMEGLVTLTTIGGRAALPIDYLMWRRMTWSGSTSVDMRYRTPSGIRIERPVFQGGIPSLFSIEPSTTVSGASEIVTADIDDSDSAFTFEYYRKIPPLTAGINWLMQDYPDLYLFGTLTEAYGFQKDAENQALWGSRRDEVIEDILKLDTRTRGPAAILVAGATP